MNKNLTFLIEQPVQLRFKDMDALGHVNNGTYFSYFEIARGTWVQNLDLSDQERDEYIHFVVAHVDADYLIPVVLSSNIVVRMYAAEPGRSSLKTFYEIVDRDNPEKIYVKSSAILVWFDAKTQKSMPIPEGIKNKLTE